MSRWLRIFFPLLPFFLIFEFSPASGSDRVFVSLSQEERAWLMANPFKQILWYNEKWSWSLLNDKVFRTCFEQFVHIPDVVGKPS